MLREWIVSVLEKKKGKLCEVVDGFFFIDIYLILERGEGKEKERERNTSMCGCLSCAPYWGCGLQPRHVP